LYRETWNERAEKRDWDWWQKEAAHIPSGRLEDEIMDITDRLDQLGRLRWLREQQQRDPGGMQDYQQVTAEATNRAPANDNEEEMER
jgi:hypothetical protein